MRRVQFECAHGPNAPADLKAAAAAAAAGDVLLRDTRGSWLLVEASSPVHLPVLAVAKIKDPTVLEKPQDETDVLEPPVVAELLDAFSLRGGQEGAFNGVSGARAAAAVASAASVHQCRGFRVRVPPCCACCAALGAFAMVWCCNSSRSSRSRSFSSSSNSSSRKDAGVSHASRLNAAVALIIIFCACRCV